jgi:transcriptional regulator with XRE-family HTH domain
MNLEEETPTFNIGAILREIRKDKGLTQETLARRSILNRGHISDLELDKKQPYFETILKLAKGLGMTPGELTDIIHDKSQFDLIFEKMPVK